MNRLSTRYFVGRHKFSDSLCVSIPEPYFYNDGAFALLHEMDSAIPFGLTVGTIHELSTLCKACTDIMDVLLNKVFILDVDLDAFSTVDPFREYYNPEQFALIDKLFTPPRAPQLQVPNQEEDEPPNLQVIFASASLAAKVASDARRQQLEHLKAMMRTLGSGVSLSDDVIANDPNEVCALCALLLSLENTDNETYFTTPVRAAIESTFNAAVCFAEKSNSPPCNVVKNGEFVSLCDLSFDSLSQSPIDV
uniref:E3 ubiquitin-protein ligase n=1 Tax=Mesocestoides corti TaxID=53468 RepID=A0A5K3FTT1_MESCO